MDNIIVKKNESLKCGSAIKVLSIISLICTALCCISFFFGYDYDYINGEEVFQLTFRSLDFITLMFLLLWIAPIILFVLYIFRFYNKLKATILVPIIFGLFSLGVVFDFLLGVGFYFTTISPLIFFACILALISALKGFNKKIFIIISMSVCLLYEALFLSGLFSIVNFHIENSRYLYLFSYCMSIIGPSAIFVALLLFGSKNKIPPILAFSPKKEKARVKKMSPEQELKLLNDKLEQGMITEEEYQAQRADIISKL